MSRVATGLLVLALLCVGCGEKHEASTDNAQAKAAGGVEGQIEAWCAAQTQGDFAAYSAFYATDFEGIKRGKRGKEKKFDRKAWMKDRKKMFKMPLQVACKSLQVGAESDGVTSVTFEQYWQSPSYADQGPKRVDLKKVDGKLMIVAEEMISSSKWDRKKFKDGASPPKRSFKTYEEIGDAGDAMGPISKKGQKEYRKCHFVKPKGWGAGPEHGPNGGKWPQACEDYIMAKYGIRE
jgi:ketosteroid isomerase-like protein